MFGGRCWRCNDSDCVDASVSDSGCLRISGPDGIGLHANRRILSRLPSRRQPFQSRCSYHCEKTAAKFIKFLLRSRTGFFAASSGPTAAHTGRQHSSARRERPRPWPQAWQAKRPFRVVVAHATELQLATALAVAPPGRAAHTAARRRWAATCTTICSCRMRSAASESR